MNFDHFQLPAFLMRDLYKESLVALKEIQQSEVTAPTLMDTALGNNKQQVLILVHYPGQKMITETDLNFLLNILNACKLSLNDVSILNLPNDDELNYTDLIGVFKPKVILLFNVKQSQIKLPVLFPEFQVQAFRDIRFISSPDLGQLQQDETLKRKLWAGLKQIFLS